MAHGLRDALWKNNPWPNKFEKVCVHYYPHGETLQINIKKECKKFCIKTFSCLIQFLKIYIIVESFFSLDYILQNPIHSAKHFLEVLCVLLLFFLMNEIGRLLTHK